MSRSLGLALCVLAACQDDVTTPFPPGLEPLEPNRVGEAESVTEELRTLSIDGELIRIFGRGYVFADPATLWTLAMDPPTMVARCSTDEQQVTLANDPAYEHSFLVHYVVRDLLNVEWDDQWRYGVVLGSRDAPALAMIKHQKTQGSDFITVSEGTIQLLATDDPTVTEVQFVEHLDAISGGPDDVLRGMQDNYGRLVASAHGLSVPGCP